MATILPPNTDLTDNAVEPVAASSGAPGVIRPRVSSEGIFSAAAKAKGLSDDVLQQGVADAKVLLVTTTNALKNMQNIQMQKVSQQSGFFSGAKPYEDNLAALEKATKRVAELDSQGLNDQNSFSTFSR